MRCTADNGTEGSIGIWLLDLDGNTIVQQCNANDNEDGIWLTELSSEKAHVIRCSNMTGNKECGLLLSMGNFAVEAANNWWGNASGPTHTSNPGGSGDDICEEDYTGTVMFDPWLSGPYELTSPCWIVPVPTVNQWGLILLSVGMAGAAVWTGRRRKRTF